MFVLTRLCDIGFLFYSFVYDTAAICEENFVGYSGVYRSLQYRSKVSYQSRPVSCATRIAITCYKYRALRYRNRVVRDLTRIS